MKKREQGKQENKSIKAIIKKKKKAAKGIHMDIHIERTNQIVITQNQNINTGRSYIGNFH